MRLKSAKIFWFPILVIFFGLGHFSEALNYSNSIDFYNESSELISKKGSGGKKGGGKKGGGKKGGAKKKGDKKTQTNLNKVQSNNEAMREKAKERYKKWKENKKAKKSNLDLDSN
tara:strand:+ start:209 stop:553 length:345 start_codon:yes stop_codon:yes gene_type:complete